MTQQGHSGITKRIETILSHKHLINVHVSVIHHTQKVEITQCPPTGEWVSNMWNNHAIKFYSARERGKVLTYA